MPLREIKLAGLGFTRTVNDRLSGFGEIAATEDGRILITAMISSSQLTGECAATFDPQFAVSVGLELIRVATEAMRNTANRAAEAAIAREP